MAMSSSEGEAAIGRFATFVSAFAVIGLAIVFGCLLLQILGRSVLVRPMAWTGEVARFASVWTCLMAAVASFEMHALHKVDLLILRLPAPARRIVMFATFLLVGMLLAFLIYYGIAMAQRVTGQRASVTGMSMAWVYMSVPVSSALMAVTLVRRIIRGQML